MAFLHEANNKLIYINSSTIFRSFSKYAYLASARATLSVLVVVCVLDFKF
jgi:hypothetical protein